MTGQRLVHWLTTDLRAVCGNVRGRCSSVRAEVTCSACLDRGQVPAVRSAAWAVR